MAEDEKRIAIYVSLYRGETEPALDTQVATCLQDARRAGSAVQIYGDVSHPGRPAGADRPGAGADLERSTGASWSGRPAATAWRTRSRSAT